jgi:hypothetical protein
MKNSNVIGIDLAKDVIQVCKIDKHGELISNKAISPNKLKELLAKTLSKLRRAAVNDPARTPKSYLMVMSEDSYDFHFFVISTTRLLTLSLRTLYHFRKHRNEY